MGDFSEFQDSVIRKSLLPYTEFNTEVKGNYLHYWHKWGPDHMGGMIDISAMSKEELWSLKYIDSHAAKLKLAYNFINSKEKDNEMQTLQYSSDM